jgi:hypothetical protein
MKDLAIHFFRNVPFFGLFLHDSPLFSSAYAPIFDVRLLIVFVDFGFFSEIRTFPLIVAVIVRVIGHNLDNAP